MGNWLFIGIVVVFIIVALVIVGLKSLGPLIRTLVNRYGPDITKTEVSLENVRIFLFSGQAELMDFHIGNPKGFTSPNAMRVGSIMIETAISSLMGGNIIIDRIEVISPEITYEKIRGSDNFKAILDNMKGSVGADKSLSKDPSGKIKEGKKIFIKSFKVNDGRVNFIIPVLGVKTVSAPLPDINLKDLGKDKGGLSPAEISNEILSALYEKIIGAAVTDILNKGLRSFGISPETIGDRTKKGIEAVTDKLKGLFGS